jgi:hypothetical protein
MHPQPPDDVSCAAWNRQVPHILGTTSPSGRSIVWDLRANKAIIHFNESRCVMSYLDVLLVLLVLLVLVMLPCSIVSNAKRQHLP